MQTAIPPGQAAHVRNWDPYALSYTPTGQECPQFRCDALLQPGTEELLGDRPWQVHAAPGHDPHSIVLFEPQDRILISADALWENGFGTSAYGASFFARYFDDRGWLRAVERWGANDGPDDLSNELKSALARGELPCIGATTEAEFKKHIEKDAALVRRFSRVDVEEPKPADAVRIVRAAGCAR